MPLGSGAKAKGLLRAPRPFAVRWFWLSAMPRRAIRGSSSSAFGDGNGRPVHPPGGGGGKFFGLHVSLAFVRISDKLASLGSRAFGLQVRMSSDRDIAWREGMPKSELPAGDPPRWDDRAHDKLHDRSCACRERILLFAHADARLAGSSLRTHGISAEKRFGDENGNVNGENGNEIKTGRQNVAARMTNKTISHVSCAHLGNPRCATKWRGSQYIRRWENTCLPTLSPCHLRRCCPCNRSGIP